jgi:hypothetical protein
LGQKRDQFLAIDEQDMIVDDGPRAEAYIAYMNQTHFEAHSLPRITESCACQRRDELATAPDCRIILRLIHP